VVTNRVSVKQPYQTFHATIVNQIPRPVCWRDGKTYEGITNLIFFPSSARAVWLKPGTAPGSKVTTSQTWQCEPRSAVEWEWEIDGKVGTDSVTTCQYQIGYRTTTVEDRKLHLTLAELRKLPPNLQAATAQLRAALPPNVINSQDQSPATKMIPLKS